jgi:hypothetical protein
MTDLDIAITILKLASRVDAGCIVCRSNTFEQARELHPDLPWKVAAEGLNQQYEDEYGWALEDLGITPPD